MLALRIDLLAFPINANRIKSTRSFYISLDVSNQHKHFFNATHALLLVDLKGIRLTEQAVDTMAVFGKLKLR